MRATRYTQSPRPASERRDGSRGIAFGVPDRSFGLPRARRIDARPIPRAGTLLHAVCRMEPLAGFFDDLDDPRTGNATRHDLHEVSPIALSAVVRGGETCAGMALFGRSKETFLRSFMRLENGIAGHDTFSRIFRLLDPAQSRACFAAFVRRFAEGLDGVVAFDGKTLRRSFDTAAGASPLHWVTAFAVEARIARADRAMASPRAARRTCR